MPEDPPDLDPDPQNEVTLLQALAARFGVQARYIDGQTEVVLLRLILGAVTELMLSIQQGGGGTGDMVKSTYDPAGVNSQLAGASGQAINAANFLTALGAVEVGKNLFTLGNPGAITFIRINANNTISALSAADFRTAIGAGTGGAGWIVKTANYTAVSGDQILANALVSGFTIELPATPAEGDQVFVAITQTNNNVVIDGNGEAIAMDGASGAPTVTYNREALLYFIFTGGDWIGTTIISQRLLDQNSNLRLPYLTLADGEWAGIHEAGIGMVALTFGAIAYLDSSDGRWKTADASAAATSAVKIGIVVGTTGLDGGAVTILLYGHIRANSAFPNMTIGARLYLSETAGEITETAPATTNAVIRTMGFANSADELFFCPSPDFTLAP